MNSLDGLSPFFRDKVEALAAKLAEIKDFPHVAWTHGIRSFADQDALWEIGRSIQNPRNATPEKPMGEIVTNAKGGESWHNYGLAVDGALKIGRQALWDFNLPYWRAYGVTAISSGFEWGGMWPGKKADHPHIQLRGGLTIVQAKDIFDVSGIDGVWSAVLKGYAQEVR